MPDGEQSQLADRLNRLFEDVRGRGGRRWTNDEVATAVKEIDPSIRVSGAYLSALRTGAKRRPSTELLAALAKFFEVSVDHLVGGETRTDAEAELSRVAENLGVRRLALRALELSPEGLAAVTKIIEQVIELDSKQAEER
jgi:transcriptional regulator with XRE-family HTH domain